MTLSKIVMQEPFILHRSCDYCNERSVARGQLILQKQLSEYGSSSFSADLPPSPQDAGLYPRLVLYVNPII